MRISEERYIKLKVRCCQLLKYEGGSSYVERKCIYFSKHERRCIFSEFQDCKWYGVDPHHYLGEKVNVSVVVRNVLHYSLLYFLLFLGTKDTEVNLSDHSGTSRRPDWHDQKPGRVHGPRNRYCRTEIRCTKKEEVYHPCPKRGTFNVPRFSLSSSYVSENSSFESCVCYSEYKMTDFV